MRQTDKTDVRRTHRLMPPTLEAGHNKQVSKHGVSENTGKTRLRYFVDKHSEDRQRSCT